MVTTRIPYMYRDGANYKLHDSLTVPGAMTATQVERLRTALDQGEFFAPDDVGMDHLLENASWEGSEDDHCWHELMLDELTVDERDTVTSFESIDEMLTVFEAASAAGWPTQFTDKWTNRGGADDDGDDGDDDIAAARQYSQASGGGLCGRPTTDGTGCRNPAGGCPHH